MAAGKLIMQIHGTHQIHGAHGLQGPHSARPAQASHSPSAQPVDQLDISAAARAASEANPSSGIRADRVAELRAQIASGTYETPGKIEQAVDRLLDAIG